MGVRQRLMPALESGFMRATATLQDPVVTLLACGSSPPILCIEEAGVVVELEFPDAESLARFQERVAAVRWIEQRRAP